MGPLILHLLLVLGGIGYGFKAKTLHARFYFLPSTLSDKRNNTHTKTDEKHPVSDRRGTSSMSVIQKAVGFDVTLMVN